jgi:phosphate:Na+ symporter
LLLLAYSFWFSPHFKQIAAGVSIFLFGMLFLEDGFKAFTGGLLENILRRSTDKRWKSISFGIATTTVMQSSSLVSVITISFLSAGLIDLAAGIGIIFGANIGTTTGAWLVAGLGLKVKISAYAMPMIVFGIILVFQKNSNLKGIGYILAGLGFLFLGIHFMKEGFDAFKDTINLTKYSVPGYPGLFIFAGIGIAATVIMQSSHATLVIIITALATGQITYDNALALAIGANVGTTITAILGAMGSAPDGKRLAGAHLVFNLTTGIIAIAFIHEFVFAVDWISSHVGIADDDYTLKLAVFHTIFNTVGVVVMLPFINRLVHLLYKVIKNPKVKRLEPLYLNDASLDFPETAIEAVRKETQHVYGLAYKLIVNSIGLKKKYLRSSDKLSNLLAEHRTISQTDIDTFYEEKIKILYSEIISFISEATYAWPEDKMEVIHWLRTANKRIIEAVKGMKHLQKNMQIHINSNDPEVKHQYDLLRTEIATVLRKMDKVWRRLSKGKYDSSINNKLDHLISSRKKREDKLNNQLIDTLHAHKISPQMCTSIMNDITYTFQIISNLIKVWQIMVALYDEMPVSSKREVEMDDFKWGYDVVTSQKYGHGVH